MTEVTPTEPKTLDSLRAAVSIGAVREAREVVSRYLPRTPLIRHPVLAEETGLELRIKHENHLPTGAFKVRGGFNLVSRLDRDARERGLVTATRGNHGQSIAMAAREFGVRCVVCVPHANNPEKNAAMRAFGAELIEDGRDFDEAREHAAELVRSEGMRLVSSGDEPDLINGVGTYSLEVFEDWPELDVMFVPLGGGSGVCGALTVFRALKPEVRVIGVQAERAASIYNSWRAGRPEPTESADTFADGLATRIPFALPFSIIKEQIDDIVLVSEEEMRSAVRLALRTTHNLLEGAGAASIAAAIKSRDKLAGKNVVAVASGANLDAANLAEVLAERS